MLPRADNGQESLIQKSYIHHVKKRHLITYS